MTRPRFSDTFAWPWHACRGGKKYTPETSGHITFNWYNRFSWGLTQHRLRKEFEI
jgi:hypothetical protein